MKYRKILGIEFKEMVCIKFSLYNLISFKEKIKHEKGEHKIESRNLRIT